MHDFNSEEARHLGACEFEKVKILQGGVTPVLARDVVSDEARRYLQNPSVGTCAASLGGGGDEGVADVCARPYWGHVFANDKTESLRLIKSLEGSQLVGYRVCAVSFIGIFFVKKKSSPLRLIVDARQPNAA